MKSSTFLEFAQFDTDFKKGTYSTMLCSKLIWTEMWDPNQKKWGLHKLLRTIILLGLSDELPNCGSFLEYKNDQINIVW